jgi:hypothetical protein
MSSCQGKKQDESKCCGIEYKCSKYGVVGCNKEGCSKQNFEGTKCRKCGNYTNWPVF